MLFIKVEFSSHGKFIYSTAVCKGKKCGFREVCSLGNDGFPFCTCPQACNGYKHKPVCGYSNGKQYSNECELYKEECDSAKTIGVMAGPCKSKMKVPECFFYVTGYFVLKHLYRRA